MHLVRNVCLYSFAAFMIVCAYHAGAYAAASLLSDAPHAMARPVPVAAEIAERVA